MGQTKWNKWFKKKSSSLSALSAFMKGLTMYIAFLFASILLKMWMKRFKNVFCVRVFIIYINIHEYRIHVARFESDNVSSSLSFRIHVIFRFVYAIECYCRSLILLISSGSQTTEANTFQNNSRMIMFHHRSLSRF